MSAVPLAVKSRAKSKVGVLASAVGVGLIEESVSKHDSKHERSRSKLLDFPALSLLKVVYKEDKQLLLSLLSANVLWPVATEWLVPWWLADAFLSHAFHDLQGDVRQQLALFCPVPGGGAVITLGYGLLLRTIATKLWRALLKGADSYVCNCLQLRLEYFVRRLVTSKVMFSDISALEHAYADVLGTAADTVALEKQLRCDVEDAFQIVLTCVPRMLLTSTRLSLTLHRFYVDLFRNYYDELKSIAKTGGNAPLPLVQKTQRKMGEIALSERYRKRRLLHAFLIAQPFAFHLCRQLVGGIVLFDEYSRMSDASSALQRKMETVVNEAIEGLSEVKVMKYSNSQLEKLDSLMANYLHAHYGLWQFLQCILEDFGDSSVWAFILECVIEFELRTRFGEVNKMAQPTLDDDDANSQVEETETDDSCDDGAIAKEARDPITGLKPARPVSANRYARIKRRCDRVWEATESLYRDCNFVRANLDRQKYVKQVLDAPSIVETDACIRKQRFGRELPPFESVRIERLYFSYSQKILLWPPSTESTPSDSSAESMAKSKKPSADGFALSISPQTPFVIESGKSYGICGRNESGKSTLVDILCKLRSAQLSQAAYNAELDFDAGVGKEEFRSQVSYVTQKPFLFEGSVGSNVHIGNPDATVDELRVACEKAGVFCENPPKKTKAKKTKKRRTVVPSREPLPRGGRYGSSHLVIDLVEGVFDLVEGVFSFFENLIQTEANASETLPTEPVKMKDATVSDECAQSDTKVASDILKKVPTAAKTVDGNRADADARLDAHVEANGTNLSDGLKQSIALARVFLRTNARVVICDEAFNSMDRVKKDSLVFPNLLKFVETHRMALAVISHSPSELFPVFDCVYVLEKGSLIAAGTHCQLLADCETYQQLCGDDKVE